jgi:hypothetical protein
MIPTSQPHCGRAHTLDGHSERKLSSRRSALDLADTGIVGVHGKMERQKERRNSYRDYRTGSFLPVLRKKCRSSGCPLSPSREGDVLDLAVTHNIVDKSGAWYSFSGERIGQGRENVRGFLKDHPEIFARIDSQLRQKLGLTGVKPAEIPAVPVNGSSQAAEAVKAPVRLRQ